MQAPPSDVPFAIEEDNFSSHANLLPKVKRHKVKAPVVEEEPVPASETLLTLVGKMKERPCKQNIRHLKNTMGTIKVLGQPTTTKVDVNALMGKEDRSLDDPTLSPHTKFNVLQSFLSIYQQKVFSAGSAGKINEGTVKYDENGKFVVQRNKEGEPIVDPTCLN